MFLYKFVLSFHIIAVISWMAGILYTYRLFVYHTAETENVVKDRFKIMERRLLRYITLPAALVALALGIAMIDLNPDLLKQGWFHVKLGLAVILLGMTHAAGVYRRQLEAGTCQRSERFFRIMNEVPTLLMIFIVLLVIVRPF